MPSTREIRRRIKSVKNTAQITRAMEMVAASRMKRAQDAVIAARPYAARLAELLSDLSSVTGGSSETSHPLLVKRPVQKAELILVTTDKGLCGALNTNILRRTARFMTAEFGDKELQLVTVGRKGRDYMRRFGRRKITGEYIALGDRPKMSQTNPIAHQVMQDYINGDVDAVYIAYSEFVNTLIQRPVVKQLLPIVPPEKKAGAKKATVDYIYEPSPEELLKQLLPRYIEVQIFQAVLEIVASEFSAKMIAMGSASKNAKELIGDLTLTYNKVRQANITREIIEVSSGAAILKK